MGLLKRKKSKEPSSKYVWKNVGRYVFPIKVKDSVRDKLAHVSFYMFVVCMAFSTWLSATGWAAVHKLLAHFSLLDQFHANLLPYVIGVVGAALATWYFIGGVRKKNEKLRKSCEKLIFHPIVQWPLSPVFNKFGLGTSHKRDNQIDVHWFVCVRSAGSHMFVCMWATSSDYRPKIYRLLQATLFVITGSVVCLSVILILLVLHRVHSDSILQRTLNESMDRYFTDPDVKMKMDQMQIELECCGSRNFSDWFKRGKKLHQVPFSCCNPSNAGPCVFRYMSSPGPIKQIAAETVYIRGCIPELRNLLLGSIIDPAVSATALTLATSLSLTVVFRYLQTSVKTVRQQKKRTGPGIGYLFIRYHGEWRRASKEKKRPKPQETESETKVRKTLHEEVVGLLPDKKSRDSGDDDDDDDDDVGEEDEGENSSEDPSEGSDDKEDTEEENEEKEAQNINKSNREEKGGEEEKRRRCPLPLKLNVSEAVAAQHQSCSSSVFSSIDDNRRRRSSTVVFDNNFYSQLRSSAAGSTWTGVSHDEAGIDVHDQLDNNDDGESWTTISNVTIERPPPRVWVQSGTSPAGASKGSMVAKLR